MSGSVARQFSGAFSGAFSGTRPGALVTALTAAALAVVASFAYQASAAHDRAGAVGPSTESHQPGRADRAEGGNGDRDRPGREHPAETALPAESGQGKRVVYSLGERRVWLVDVPADGADETVVDNYAVHPSSVDPPPGEYSVTSRTPQVRGSDGVPVENVVVFHVSEDGVVFGFSSALDGSLPDPDSTQRTGGVRQSPEDGATLWTFAEVGDAVVVVP